MKKILKTLETRWLALYILCLGVLMIVLDTTIVNVALPSIKTDLGFTESSLAWIVNAYMLTSGGFLLLGGRLGDLFGHKKLFLLGLTAFTLASLGCGLAQEQTLLIAMRTLQGVGAAVVTSVALSLVMNLFPEDQERAKAMGVYGFVCASGGSIGVLLGGILTSFLNWHWIFLVNIPIGVAVYTLCKKLVPSAHVKKDSHLDVAGAITITTALMTAVYAIVNGNQVGWLSQQTLGLLGAAFAIFLVFLVIESKVKAPLMPLSIFKLRNVSLSSMIGTLWSAAMFAQFFISALYLQQVLGFTPLQVGLSFLPANLIMAFLSLGASAKLVNRFGIKPNLITGLSLSAISLFLFAQAPVDGSFTMNILPGMLLLGIGGGISFNPLLLAAMHDAPKNESGLVSGVVNTAFMMGGALGLAILASVAGFVTTQLSIETSELTALTSGYQAAFLTGSCFALVAIGLAANLRLKKAVVGASTTSI